MVNWVSILIILTIGIIFHYIVYDKYKKTKSRQLLAWLPGLWTSLGILGTFASIIYALSNNNPWDLIENIGPAFWTSIVGIIAAIAEGSRNKFIIAEEDSEFEKSHPTIEDCLIEIDRNQKENFSKLILEVNSSLKELILLARESQSICKSIDYHEQEGRNQLLLSLDKNNYMISDHIKQQQIYLCDFLTSFSNNVQNMFDTFRNSSTNTIGEFVKEQMEKTDDIIRRSTTQTSENLERILMTLNENIKNTVEQCNRQLNVVTSSISSVMAGFSSKNVQQWTEFQSKQKLQMEEMHIVNDELMKNHLSTISSYFNSSNQQLYANLSGINESLKTMTSDIQNNYLLISDKVVEVLKQSVEIMERHQHNINDSNNNIVSSTATYFANQIELMKAQTDAINTNICQSMEELKSIKETMMQENKDTMEKSSLLVKEQIEVMRDFNKEIIETINQYNKDSIENDKVLIGQIKNEFSTTLSSVTIEAKEIMTGLQDGLKTCLSELKKTCDYIDEKVVEIKENYTQSAEVYKQAIELAHNNNEFTEKTLSSLQENISLQKESNKNANELIETVKNQQNNSMQLALQIQKVSQAIDTLKSLEIQLNKITCK